MFGRRLYSIYSLYKTTRRQRSRTCWLLRRLSWEARGCLSALRVHRRDKYVCASEGFFLATYIMANGGIIAGRERGGDVLREGRGKHCEMDVLARRNDLATSPPHPTLFLRSLHGSQTKCFPLNCAISPCPRPYIIVSVRPDSLALSRRPLFPSPELSIKLLPRGPLHISYLFNLGGNCPSPS